MSYWIKKGYGSIFDVMLLVGEKYGTALRVVLCFSTRIGHYQAHLQKDAGRQGTTLRYVIFDNPRAIEASSEHTALVSVPATIASASMCSYHRLAALCVVQEVVSGFVFRL